MLQKVLDIFIVISSILSIFYSLYFIFKPEITGFYIIAKLISIVYLIILAFKFGEILTKIKKNI